MIGRRISHYRIDAHLGAGGMGEVFLAHDVALDRAAAIKLLPDSFRPELRQRLLVEAESSSRLQHPGIATFYETGEDRGVTYIAMEFVEGETLRSRLARGRLTRDEALALVTGLLEALGHAHAAGVVHRDIKPENLMVTRQGVAKLLDFGLALRPAPAEPTEAGPDQPTRAMLTAAGMIVGSPGYMPPEQFIGDGIDERADLFAVGAVLYEALSGRAAFPGATSGARLAATLAPGPPPLTGDLADLGAIIARALDRDRSQRFASAAQMLKDVRKAARGESVAALRPTIAVLDFANRTGAPDRDWIGAGIAESLTADLDGYAEAGAVPRARIQREAAAASAGADPILLAKRLGARYLIHGSYQSAGDALRIVMEIEDVPAERALGTHKIDGAMGDLFALQDALAARAASTLELPQRRVPAPAARPGALEAYECYTRGRTLWTRMTKGGFDEAQDLFESAIAQDPHYADALASLAALHDMRFTFTTDRGQLRRAADYAERAIERDPDHADAHIWLAYARWRQGANDEALGLLRRAGEIDGTNFYPPYFEGTILQSLERSAEAIPLLQRTIRTMPSFGFAWVALGNAHMETGKPAEAIWVLEKGIELESKGYHATAGADGYLGECLRQQRRMDEARAHCLAGLESVERTDHMYRDTFRAMCLCALGRTTWDQGDREAARSAFLQCALHLEGRSSTLGGGYFMTQAAVGKALAEGDAAALASAAQLFERRDRFDWSWIWLGSATIARRDLARAREELG